LENEEELQIVKRGSNSVRTVNRRHYNFIGQISPRKSLEGYDLLWEKYVRLKLTGRRRRRKQLPDDLMETRGYWDLNKETVDSAVWRTCFGRS
jgi:hypothetical protein